VATVELYPAGSDARELWQNALDLMRHLEGDWTLIGGLMVQLHAERYGRTGARATNDTDILANSRSRPGGTERISATLTRLGFELLPRRFEPHGSLRLGADPRGARHLPADAYPVRSIRAVT